MICVSVHLNKDFVSFLLDYIEAPPAKDKLEEIRNYFVNLILAFNLHFCDLQKNSVMAVLGERGTATVFTEKLMLLVNRGGEKIDSYTFQYFNMEFKSNFLYLNMCNLVMGG